MRCSGIWYHVLMIPILLGGLICLYLLNKECEQQAILSDIVNQNIISLGIFRYGIILLSILLSAATFALLSASWKKVALGTAFWGMVAAVLLSCVGLTLANDLDRWEKKMVSFDSHMNNIIPNWTSKHGYSACKNSRNHFDLVMYLQMKYKCCGLQNYTDYLTPTMQKYIMLNEETVPLPSSCCQTPGTNCNPTFLKNAKHLMIGCSKYIVESVSSCRKAVGLSVVLMMILSIIALCITWAFLRHCQNLSFWDFGRVAIRKRNTSQNLKNTINTLSKLE